MKGAGRIPHNSGEARCLQTNDSSGRIRAVSMEITDLAKLGIDDFTLQRALYGDLQVTIRNKAGFPDDWSRKATASFSGPLASPPLSLRACT